MKRLAAKISSDKLFEFYKNKIEKKYNGAKYLSFNDILNIDKIHEDISKVDFDFENLFYRSEDNFRGENIVGPQFLDNFSFIGCNAGGDWEHPVYFIIYLDKDGKTLRGYVPKDGNSYNYNTKAALGNDEDEDLEFLKKFFKNKDKTITDEELNYVRYDDGDCMFDFELILKDIKNRIEVV
jgi:hypothetical protein